MYINKKNIERKFSAFILNSIKLNSATTYEFNYIKVLGNTI